MYLFVVQHLCLFAEEVGDSEYKCGFIDGPGILKAVVGVKSEGLLAEVGWS